MYQLHLHHTLTREFQPKTNASPHSPPIWGLTPSLISVSSPFSFLSFERALIASFFCALQKLHLSRACGRPCDLCQSAALRLHGRFPAPATVHSRCCSQPHDFPVALAGWLGGSGPEQSLAQLCPQPGPPAVAGIERRRNLGRAAPRAEPPEGRSGAWPGPRPVTCSKAGSERVFPGLFISKCDFTEAYSAFLTGLTGCQYSKLASY